MAHTTLERSGYIVLGEEALALAQQNEEKGRSAEQAQQAAKNSAGSGKSPESDGFDKKLDGPNRPST